MNNYLTKILLAQFEAALRMMKHCVDACPPRFWEGKVANATFRQLAYHTLYYVDLYLSPNPMAFERRDLHSRGGHRRGPTGCTALSKQETLAYLTICRRKAIQILAAETAESLQGPCGFPWRKVSRGELHIYNIRHIQHHTGQLSAYLRRVDRAIEKRNSLPWVASG